MKSSIPRLTLPSGLLTWLLCATLTGLSPGTPTLAATTPNPPLRAQPEEPPPQEPAPAAPDAEPEAAAPDDPSANDAESEVPPEPVPNPEPSPTRPTPATRPPGPNAQPTPTLIRNLPSATNGEDERNLHLNFRGAPLELVLDYLSEAAGFIIDLQTEVKGKVDVWSSQPLTRGEAVEVLNSVLHRNGYAAIRSGRTLTIVTREEARRMNIPVISGGDPSQIPPSDEMVTQIIPVRFINATQLTKDLELLMPPQATLTANEGGNALVITDTQANIRRMAEIVRALDTAISATSAVRVFPLKYADAKALATLVTELFQSQSTQQSTGNPMQQFFRGQGGPFGQQRNTQQTTSPAGRVATPRVVATADERSNSLVVSAPEDHMPVIEDLVREVDTNVEDITEVRVFRLQYADAQETADLLTSLFPDPTTTTTTQNNRGQLQFGGRSGLQAMAAAAASAPSSRMQMQTRVTAVPDLRTGSVVVSASRQLMTQIAQMIEVLDADPARQQKVFVFDVENTDPQVVQEVLQRLFPSPNNATISTTTSQRQTGSQLNTRATQMQNQNLNTVSGFGTTTGSSAGR
jgi:type II secretory pathway component GspD/PulD (secretin)